MASFDSNGVRISYIAEGAGPPVALVHGLASSIEKNWHRPGVIDALLGAGRRVVALDCRGHGESEKPHEASAYSGTKMGDEVVALWTTWASTSRISSAIRWAARLRRRCSPAGLNAFDAS